MNCDVFICIRDDYFLGLFKVYVVLEFYFFVVSFLIFKFFKNIKIFKKLIFREIWYYIFFCEDIFVIIWLIIERIVEMIIIIEYFVF